MIRSPLHALPRNSHVTSRDRRGPRPRRCRSGCSSDRRDGGNQVTRPKLPSLIRTLLLVSLAGAATQVEAAKLKGVSILDKDYLVVHLSDGDVTHEAPGEVVTRYTPVLSTDAAGQTANWTISSSQDASYGVAGKNPLNSYRKTKLSGHAQMEWGRQRLPLRVHLRALDLPEATHFPEAGDDLHAGHRIRRSTATRPLRPSPSTSTTAAPRRCTSTWWAMLPTLPTRPPTSTTGWAAGEPGTTPLRGQPGLRLQREHRCHDGRSGRSPSGWRAATTSSTTT